MLPLSKNLERQKLSLRNLSTLSGCFYSFHLSYNESMHRREDLALWSLSPKLIGWWWICAESSKPNSWQVLSPWTWRVYNAISLENFQVNCSDFNSISQQRPFTAVANNKKVPPSNLIVVLPCSSICGSYFGIGWLRYLRLPSHIVIGKK